MKTVLVAFLLAIGAFHSPHASAVTEAATVNGKVISQELLNSVYLDQYKALGAAAASKKDLLEELIRREATFQAAKQSKIEDEATVQLQIQTVINNAFIEKSLSSEFAKLSVNDDEARAFYEKNPEIRTSQIFISVQSNNASELQQKAIGRLNQILKDIRTQKITFSEAAQRYSEDASARNGGDLGYRTRDFIEPTFYANAVKLGRVGEISSPVVTIYGVHLIRLTGKKTWRETDQNKVKRLVIDEKRRKLIDSFVAGLKDKAKVKISL